MEITNAKKAWLSWFCCSIFFAYQYILRVLPNIISNDLMIQLKIEASQIGQISGIYYFGYAGAQIPLGILFDRLNIKYIMPICVLLAALSSLGMNYATNWPTLVVLRLLVGVGSAGAVVGLFKVINLGFDSSKASLMFGLAITIGFIGTVYGGGPMAYLVKNQGFHQAINFLVIIGVVLAGILFFILPSIQTVRKEAILDDIKAVLGNYRLVSICLIGGLMVGPIEGFADGWSAQFLQKFYRLSVTSAASFPSIMFIGMGLGAPILAYIAAKTGEVLKIVIYSAFVMAFSMGIILYYPVPKIVLFILCSIIGILSSYQIIVIYKAASYVDRRLDALASAAANMIIMIFGYVFHSSIGFAMDLFWDGTLLEERRAYNIITYQQALSIIIVALIIAGVGFIILNMREPKMRKVQS